MQDMFKITDAIEQEAAQWLAREQSGAMTDPQRADMHRWISSSPANESALAYMRRTLAVVDRNAEALLAAEFEQELHDLADETRREDSGRFRKMAAGIALAAATGLSLAVGIPMLRLSPATDVVDFATATGEIRTVHLSDGSTVELNTGSKIEVRYSKDAREVVLVAGEGFFDVQKNAQRPFIVRTEKARVTVTGTSFSISTYDARTIVQVLTGKVAVKGDRGDASNLVAGAMVAVDGIGAIGPVAAFDPALALAWRQGKLQFANAPLPEVIDALNRYFDRPIALDGPGISDLRVTGEFDVHDRDTAVEALALIFELEVDESGGTLILRNKTHGSQE